MDSFTNLTPQQLRHAADIQERILALQDQLNAIVGITPGRAAEAGDGKRRLSPQGLANIRAGAQKRRAKFHGKSSDGQTNKKPKRKMSAAGRAAIAARMKARWAAAKKAGRNVL